jgi:hypothetical protein
MRPLLFLLALWITAAPAEDHAHDHSSLSPEDAQVVVTINPEARVSAVIAAPLSTPAPCGSATRLEIKVINQGFVTAPLRAAIVGDGARHVALRMDNTKLSGGPEDSRTLQLIPRGPDPVDVTIAFSVDDDIGDLGGRDRVHFLVRCLDPAAER